MLQCCGEDGEGEGGGEGETGEGCGHTHSPLRPWRRDEGPGGLSSGVAYVGGEVWPSSAESGVLPPPEKRGGLFLSF